jgi:predicted PurR-regulated permease PerM
MQKEAESLRADRGNIRDTMLIAAAVVVVIAGAKLSADMLMPLLLAMFIAVICSAPLNLLIRRGTPVWAAATIVSVAVLAVMSTLLLLIDSAVEEFVDRLPVYQEEFHVLTLHWVTWLADHGVDVRHSWFGSSGAVSPGDAMYFFGGFLTGMGETLSNMVVIIFTVVFMLADAPSFQRKLMLADRGRNRNSLRSLRALTTSMNDYVATKASISLATGLLIWAGLHFMGVEFAMLWGVLAFLLNFVPNIGSVLAAAPPVLLSLLEGNYAETLVIGALYVSINVLVGNIIEPRIMGNRLGLSTLAVFLSLLFWGWMFEHIGMLLSVPLTMVVRFFAMQHPSTAWFALLVSNLPAEREESEEPAVEVGQPLREYVERR